MDEERREFSRAAFQESVQYRMNGTEVAKGSLAFDVSEGGVRFQGFDFIPLNTYLAVHMDLFPENSIDLHGRVVWAKVVPHSERYHIGVKFDEDQALQSSRSVIRKYVQSYQSK